MQTCSYEKCERQKQDLESLNFYCQKDEKAYHVGCSMRLREELYEKDGWKRRPSGKAEHRNGLEITVEELFAMEEYGFMQMKGRAYFERR